jgi:hypothetical protein
LPEKEVLRLVAAKGGDLIADARWPAFSLMPAGVNTPN